MWKPSSKFLSIIIVIAEVGAVSVAASTTPSVSNVSASSTIVSSEKEVSNVQDGVTEIQEATDEGVSRIKDETAKAVQTIQNNLPNSSSTSGQSSSGASTGSIPVSTSSSDSEPKYYNIATSGSINVTKTYKGQLQADILTIPNRQNADKVSNGFIILSYQLNGVKGGLNDESGFDTVSGLKSSGFVMSDANGKSVELEGVGTQIKVPFANISDVSTLYLIYNGQKITINIT